MQLYNPELETTILKAICTLNPVDAGKLLANIGNESFYDESARDAFDFIRNQSLENGQMPSWEYVTTSPDLNQSTRDFLLATNAVKVKNKSHINKLIQSAKKYEQLRTLYFAADSVITMVSGDSVDITEATQILDEASAEIRTKISGVREQIKHIGTGNNTLDLVNRVLNPTEIQVIPTGFKQFDERNGGLPIGDLVMGSANTGGGKTAVMAIQLLINLSKHVPTCLVPLEMTEEQTMARVLANLAKIKIHKISSGKLTAEEKERADKAYLKFARRQKKAKTRYSIWDPGRDVDIDEVLYSLLPFGFKVIMVDYVGLLKGMDEDNQARALGAAARRAKIFAKNTGITVVLLAQLGDDGRVRYSRAMSEHAAVAWHWLYTEKERESGIITIVPYKSRNQDPTPFDLVADFSTMSAYDATDADYVSKNDPDGTATVTKVKERHKELESLAKDIDEYNLDDDEDE